MASGSTRLSGSCQDCLPYYQYKMHAAVSNKTELQYRLYAFKVVEKEVEVKQRISYGLCADT